MVGEKTLLWGHIPEAPPDPIVGVAAAFRADPATQKVNLGVGAYRDAKGKPYVLPVVHKVEKALLEAGEDHEYLPIEGLAAFNIASQKLILGKDCNAIKEGRVVTMQSLSGTGSLRVAFEFIAKYYRYPVGSNNVPKVYVPNPTWSNHNQIVPAAGLGDTQKYRYYDAKTGGVDYENMCADLNAAPDGSVVLFHGCAHNPTGADPTEQQWKGLLEICKKKHFVVLFDNAYQGFASGDLNKDAWSVRFFVDAGLEVFITQSFAKNMGLYGERVGAVSLVMASTTPEVTAAVVSQLKIIIRSMYSSPPALGAKIAAKILGDPALFAEWEQELKKMSGRIYDMRVHLRDALIANGTPGTWQHVVDQIGMFSFTGLTAQQVAFMREKYHIYMTSNGRISLAGLNDSNIKYVADAMKDAVITHPATGGKL
eukprot:CAMPEP_0184697774 /NCGR_PEP_ID=MMETSP0313-20130426/4619_1 /TAXON_ID=2792 /ORGANISM="Porphyridium aerugineum, Strain SAG 1380-2" /LENGTH=424 /DNA_ID=CAMNT_0027156611 /DNA_START=410 /DNA_END=1684 /DNA_ORIENTATION=+